MQPARRETGKVLRALLFVFGFAGAAVAVWCGAERVVELSKAPGIALSLDVIGQVNDLVRRLREDPGSDRVAFIGDSTCMAAHDMTDPVGQSLPARVAEAMREASPRGRRANLVPLCVAGLGPQGQYFVADHVLEGHPDRIVLALNMRGFNSSTMHAYGFAEAAGWISGGQLLESLRLPVFAVGLTMDRLLLYKALFSLGVVEQWIDLRQLQGRLYNAHEPFALDIESRLGIQASGGMQFGLGIARLMRTQAPQANRASREFAEQTLRPVLDGLTDDAANLRFLRATLARFRRAGVPTLVYVEPTNLEHLRSVGLDLGRFPQSIDAIAAVVREEAALFADFHALLPDSAFRDSGDHYTFTGTPNGTSRLGEQLALVVTRDLLPARGR